MPILATCELGNCRILESRGGLVEQMDRVMHGERRGSFCVEALTRSSLAKWERYALTSAFPISCGWRLSWNRTKRLTHPT